jgi:transcription initiation factor TFIID TATA-box-binding protein
LGDGVFHVLLLLYFFPWNRLLVINGEPKQLSFSLYAKYGERWLMEKTALSKPEIIIHNVVATGSLKHGFDLNAIIKAFPHVNYRPEVFPGLPFRLKKPKTCTLIFKTGKMVCTGAKSEKESKRAVMKVVREMNKSGIIILGKPEIKVVNIVATANLSGRIELEEAAYSLDRTMYEPEQFPGLIYRMDKPKVVILLFASGKIVCTGATREEDVYEAVAKLHKKLEEKELIYYD